jgi:putative sigma-54 modulation protein
MDVRIRGNDIQINDRIRNAVQDRADRLGRFLPNVVAADLELRHHHRRSGRDAVIAQFTINPGGALLRAEEEDHDAERAVELVMEKMERQARRFHERRSGRPAQRAQPLESPEEVSESDIEAQAVARVKRFPVKPIGQDEAIEQMELLGHDFFLFQNRDEGSISLLYRRRDGAIGMLVPEPM